VTLENRLRLVAAIGQEARRPGLDRAFADCGSLRQDSIRIELVAPAGHIAHAPR
jgi:hypothetical protein